jgi:hypothetical protein
MLGRVILTSRLTSRRVAALSAAASLLLLLSDRAMAGEPPPPPGCGTYTDWVENCPDQAHIDKECEDHKGPCEIQSASCSELLGRDKIICDYQDPA